MMDTFWIANGQLALPDQIVSMGSLLVKNGQIAEVNQQCPLGVPEVDAEGGYILPGFIDLHLHGGGGADFMDGTADAIRTVARVHCQHGTTAMLPTTITCSDELLEDFIHLYLQVKREGTGSADFLGLHLEGPYFSSTSKGAQPVTAQRIPEKKTLERILGLAQGEIRRWDAAPEMDGMEMFARTMTENGVMASIAHTNAVAEEAERAFDWGFSHLTHFYNGMTTFHKVNGLVYAGVIEATYLRKDATVELIGDGKHIPRQSMQLALLLKGADKVALITDAMRAAGTHEKKSILGPLSCGVKVVIKDEVAQLCDFSSFAGSIATMDQVLRVAHCTYGISLAEVSRMLSLTPARLCGVSKQKGSLEPGKDADVVILSPDFQVRRVYVRGKAIDS
ncbi:MAG: N-acetylglucosamine-6-phosphate deacetylase [Eubacteriales bacterium]|nr:N-acetylglucosamine-6-phosphate deacetylase [Eubacteriales bacterium]